MAQNLSTRVLSDDPAAGIVELFHYDEDTNQVTIETIQDVGDIIEQNKRIANEHTSLDRWGEWTRVAQIPMPLYFDLKAKGILDDDKAMKLWLNSAENRFFRTRPGVV